MNIDKIMEKVFIESETKISVPMFLKHNDIISLIYSKFPTKFGMKWNFIEYDPKHKSISSVGTTNVSDTVEGLVDAQRIKVITPSSKDKSDFRDTIEQSIKTGEFEEYWDVSDYDLRDILRYLK